MADAETEQGSPFWRFSLRFYRRPGVADACIALQDGCGVDVNILLFLLWLATERRCAHLDVVQMVCATAAPWRDDVVAPLRGIRRRLKEGSGLVERSAAEQFRARIKAVELEAERLQQEALFALADGLAMERAVSVEDAAFFNMAVYEYVLGRLLDAAAIETLLEAVRAEARPEDSVPPTSH
jgi:uncharacterized protein (TIGR02444 family)